MILSAHIANPHPTSTLKEDALSLMSGAVEKFQSRVRRVDVSIRDINGPRGGVDKRCRCVVHLKRMAPIVIEDHGENYSSLLNRVADRVAYTLSQKIDRIQSSRRLGNRKVVNGKGAVGPYSVGPYSVGPYNSGPYNSESEDPISLEHDVLGLWSRSPGSAG